jgi:hypothetical protein
MSFKKERLENVPNNLKTLLQESKRDIERLLEVEKKNIYKCGRTISSNFRKNK